MAIEYVGGRGAGRAGSTSSVNVAISSGLSGGLSSSAAAGDLCVVTVSTATQGRSPSCAIATPTGFTPLTVQRTTATTYDTNVQTCYKILTAGDVTSGITIPSTGNIADGQAYTIQVFRGVDATTPMDATAQYATGSGTNNRFDAPAITPVTAGAWILICGGGAASTGTTVYTAPTGFTTNWLSFNGPDTNDGTVGAGYYTGWTSGSYNPAVVGGGSVNAANSWGATTIALRPAATDITLELSGVSSTGAVGSVSPSVAYEAALTGVSASSAVGSVGPSVSDVAVPWTDTFNRSELGAHWVTVAGTAGIVSNALKASSAPAALFAAGVSSPPANVRVKATIKVDGTIALYARVSPTVDKYVFAIIGAGNAIITDHDNAGAPVDLTVAATSGVSWSPGDVFELQVNGVVAEVFKNGVSVLSNVGGTDLRLTAAGYSGVYFDSTTPEIDDFTIEQASISVALSGVSQAGAVGALAASRAVPMTGSSATSARGSLAPAAAVAMTGASSTGAVGTMTASVTKIAQLTGVAASTALGSLQKAFQRAFTGLGSTGATGSLLPAASKALTGSGGTGTTGTLTMTANRALAGSGASAQAGTMVSVVQRALVGGGITGYTGSLTPSIDTDITVQLTGVSAATSIGLLGASFALGLTGRSATPSVGALVVSFSRQATGIASTTGLGSLTRSITRALAGSASTGSVGTLTPSYATEVALNGVLAAGSVGSLSRGVTQFALSGVAAAGSVGNLTPSFAREVALSGVSASTAVGSLTKTFTRPLTGQALDAEIGNVGISTGATLVALNGVQCAADIGLLSPGLALQLLWPNKGVHCQPYTSGSYFGRVPHHADLNVTDAFTIEFRLVVRRHLASNGYAFHPFVKGSPGQWTCGPVVYIFGPLATGSDRRLGIYAGVQVGWTSITNNAEVPTGREIHVAATYSKASGWGRLYFDGVSVVAPLARAYDIGQNTDDLHILKNDGTTAAPDFDMWDVRYWNVERSQAEIVATMNSPLNGDEPGLIGYWPCDEDYGIIAHDRSIASRHATFTNTVSAPPPMSWNTPKVVVGQGSIGKAFAALLTGGGLQGFLDALYPMQPRPNIAARTATVRGADSRVIILSQSRVASITEMQRVWEVPNDREWELDQQNRG